MTGRFLQVRHLSKGFDVTRGILARRVGRIRALDDVSFHLDDGEVLGLVGESGCGKSTLARVLTGLIPPDAGEILVDGVPVRPLSEGPRPFQMVFQDPFSSLDPRMPVGDSVAEPLLALGVPARERRGRMLAALESVGLDAAAAGRYPHQFSGGQRQRIAIARALVTNPRFVVCDEAVSALDASVRAQILNLLDERRRQTGFASLFISHDLAVVGHMSDRIAVMHFGRVVEEASGDDLLSDPLHPYTKMLLASVPTLDGIGNGVSTSGEESVPAEPPSPLHPPRGCPFLSRCPEADGVCAAVCPRPRRLGNGRMVACHRFAEEA